MASDHPISPMMEVFGKRESVTAIPPQKGSTNVEPST
jgi:hypothetical protein